MATFALDPMNFVPHGFDIVDGGELRLPRTFFAPAVAPDRQHEDYAIAIVEPALCLKKSQSFGTWSVTLLLMIWVEQF